MVVNKTDFFLAVKGFKLTQALFEVFYPLCAHSDTTPSVASITEPLCPWLIESVAAMYLPLALQGATVVYGGRPTAERKW